MFSVVGAKVWLNKEAFGVHYNSLRGQPTETENDDLTKIKDSVNNDTTTTVDDGGWDRVNDSRTLTEDDSVHDPGLGPTSTGVFVGAFSTGGPTRTIR